MGVQNHESAFFPPKIEDIDPILDGVSLRFMRISDSVMVWRLKVNHLEMGDNIDNISPASTREHYHTIRKKILAHYLSLKESDILIEPDEMGKPVLIHPKTDLSFSTSYTRSCWVFVLSRSGPIGIDIEDMNSDPDILKIARRFFHQNEFEYLSNIPKIHRVRTFYQFWTLKEAYLKAMGTGLAGLMDLPDFSIYIRNFQEIQKEPCSLGCGFQAHILQFDSACMTVVFPENSNA